ncbi:MAG: sigma-54-dependent Fis family transcriptional regulator [Desulfobacterales bacterium]|jgi:transcriptional regulator with GAF, ATPase, and Fis domain
MGEIDLDFYKVLFEDLDPENLKKRFLKLLLRIQNVDRGSIWVKRENRYVCIEALESPTDADTIKGASISTDRPSIVGWVMENAEMTVAEAGKDPRHYKEFEEGWKVKSVWILAFPLILRNGQIYGVVHLIDTNKDNKRLNIDEKYLKLLKSIVDMGSIALSNALNYAEQLERNLELEQTLAEIQSKVQIIGQSRPFIDVMKRVREYARTDFQVLITGESGTGKDLIAMALHNLSSRNNKPFVVQNCSAIPDTLLESELFGYKKGAFTGATEDKTGLLKAADGGTVFLDEIGDMSLHLQSRILRVIQNNEIKPLGETRTSKINIRIISATNKDLNQAIAKKEFREDLFYRINVLPLHLPPLRERKKDIPLLLNYFLKREALKLGVSQKRISKKALQYLEDYQWEGNIRELENFIKYILSTVDNDIVGVNEIPDHFKKKEIYKRDVINTFDFQKEPMFSDKSFSPATAESPFAGCSWEELEKDYVLYLLNKNRWNITRAANDAKINRSTFDSRMKKLGINKR